MIILPKKESFVHVNAKISLGLKERKHCWSVNGVISNSIPYLEVLNKSIVLSVVERKLVEEGGHLRYQKPGMLKDLWRIILSRVNWLDQLFVKNVTWVIEKLNRLIMIIANHLKLDGYVLLVTENGTEQNQNMQQYQLKFRKRYAKFIGKEDEWQTLTAPLQ